MSAPVQVKILSPSGSPNQARRQAGAQSLPQCRAALLGLEAAGRCHQITLGGVLDVLGAVVVEEASPRRRARCSRCCPRSGRPPPRSSRPTSCRWRSCTRTTRRAHATVVFQMSSLRSRVSCACAHVGLPVPRAPHLRVVVTGDGGVGGLGHRTGARSRTLGVGALGPHDTEGGRHRVPAAQVLGDQPVLHQRPLRQARDVVVDRERSAVVGAELGPLGVSGQPPGRRHLGEPIVQHGAADLGPAAEVGAAAGRPGQAAPAHPRRRRPAARPSRPRRPSRARSTFTRPSRRDGTAVSVP